MGLEGVVWADSPLDEYIRSISSHRFFPPSSSSLSAELRLQKESGVLPTSTSKTSSSFHEDFPLPYADSPSSPLSSRLPIFSERRDHRHKHDDEDDGVGEKMLNPLPSKYFICNQKTSSTFSYPSSSSSSSYHYSYHGDSHDSHDTPLSPLWREGVLFPFRLCQPIFGSQRLSKFLSFVATSTLQIVWGSLCLQCQAVAVSAGILESSASCFDDDNDSDRRKRRWRRRNEEEEERFSSTEAADDVLLMANKEGEEESNSRSWRRRVWETAWGGRKGGSGVILLFSVLLFLFGYLCWWEGGENGKEEGEEEGEGNDGVCASLERMWGKESEAEKQQQQQQQQRYHLLYEKWVSSSSSSSVCAASEETKEKLPWKYSVGKYYYLIGMITGRMLITITKMMMTLLMMTIISLGKGLGYIAVGGVIVMGIFLGGVFIWHALFLSRFHRFVEVLVSGWRVSKQCLRWIQEVELMQRGFRLSEPLAPISRIEQSDRWLRRDSEQQRRSLLEKQTFSRLLPSTVDETKASGSSDSKSNSSNTHSCNSSNDITDISSGSSNYITVNSNRSGSSSNKSSGCLHSCRTSTSSLRIAVFRFLDSMQILFFQHSLYIQNCMAAGCAFCPPPFLPPPSVSSPVVVEQEEKEESMKRGENNNYYDNISIVELKNSMTSLWRSQTSYCASLQSCLLGSVGSTFYVRQQFEHFPPSPSSSSIITSSKRIENGFSEDFSCDFFSLLSRAFQAEHRSGKGGGSGGRRGGGSWLIFFSYFFHYLAGSCSVAFSLAKEFCRSLRLGALYTLIIYRSLRELLTSLETHLEILRFQLLSEWISVGHVDVVEDFSAFPIGDTRNLKNGWNERTTIDLAKEEGTTPSSNSNSGSSSSSSDNNIRITNCNSSRSVVPCGNKKSWWLRWCLVRWLAISPSSPVVMLTEVGGLQKQPRSLLPSPLVDKKEKRGKGKGGKDNDEDEDNNDGSDDYFLEEERLRKSTTATLASMAASLRREWSLLNVSVATALVTLRLRSQLLPSTYWRRRSSEEVSIFKRINNSHNNYSYNDKTIPSTTTTTTTTSVSRVVKELCGRNGMLPVLLEKFIKVSCCLISSLFSFSFFSSPFPWASFWMSGGSAAKADSSSVKRSKTHCPSILFAQSLRVRQTELKEMEGMLESVRVPLGNAMDQCWQLRQTLETQQSKVAALQSWIEGEGDILHLSGKDGKGNKEGEREDEETDGGGKKLLMDVSGRMLGKKKSEESCLPWEKEESKKNGKCLEIYCAVGCPHEMKSRRKMGEKMEEWEKEAEEEDDEGEERRRAQKMREEGKKTVEELKAVLGSSDRYSYQMNLGLWDEEEKSHRGDGHEGEWRLEETLEERRGKSQKSRPRLRREDLIVVRGITEDEFGRQVISERRCMRNVCPSNNNGSSSDSSSSSHNNSSGSCSRSGDSSGICSSSGNSSGICSSSGDSSGIVNNIFDRDSICGWSRGGGGGDSREGRDYSLSEGEAEEAGSSSAFDFGTASSDTAAVLSELQSALEMRRKHAKENF